MWPLCVTPWSKAEKDQTDKGREPLLEHLQLPLWLSDQPMPHRVGKLKAQVQPPNQISAKEKP